MGIRESHWVPKLEEPIRLSDYLGGVFATIPSRKGMKKAILKGLVQVNEQVASTGLFLQGGERIDLLEEEKEWPVFEFPLPVVYEDDFLAVVHKPAGLLVSGNSFRTLVNALPFSLQKSGLPDAVQRPQPVHRLDYPTSGLLLVGKTHSVITALNQAFSARAIKKTYYAVTIGPMTDDMGRITSPIDEKTACSTFKVVDRLVSEKYEALNLVQWSPETGRRHQLRKHSALLGNPILGDKEYGKPGLIQYGNGLYLCAAGLEFQHPCTPQRLTLKIDLPKKFTRLFGEVKIEFT